jgi:hypothetical protein
MALAALLLASRVRAQTPGLQPSPVPLPAPPQTAPTNIIIGAPQPIPAAPVPPASAPAVPAPPPAAPGLPAPLYTAPPPPAPLLPAPPPPAVPLFQAGPSCNPSITDGVYFVTLEFLVLDPHVSNHLAGIAFRTNGTAALLAVPSVPLTWTVSPRLELGVHLPDNGGDVVFGYRFLASEGTGLVVGGGDAFAVKSRLNANLFDLDYGSPRTEIAPRWDAKWWIGLRGSTVYYDTTSANSLLFTEKASNYFVGAGPHGGIQFERQFSILPAFSLFGRADGYLLIGQIRQRYSETFPDGPADPLTAALQVQRTQTVPVISLQAGLNYNPPGLPYLHFSTGYEFERWWSLGRVGDANLNLTTQGVFLRGEFDF